MWCVFGYDGQRQRNVMLLIRIVHTALSHFLSNKFGSDVCKESDVVTKRQRGVWIYIGATLNANVCGCK